MSRLLVWAVALCAVAGAAGQDPAQGWLGYATGKSPSGKGRITRAEAKWVVLDEPREGGCFYSPWFGIETSDNLNLFQPVNPYVGGGWEFYVEYFQWSPTHNENSESHSVRPGDVLHGVVTFNEAEQSYTAVHTNLNTSQSITKTIKVQEKESGGYKEYTMMYVVFEKTCSSCAQYPPNDKVTFFDIVLEYEGEKVSPSWTTGYVDDRCDNRAHIVDPSTVTITWKSGSGAVRAEAEPVLRDDEVLVTREAAAKATKRAGGLWRGSAEQGAFFRGATVREVRGLLGARRSLRSALPRRTYGEMAVPASFDAREQWPECATIGQIRDQSACGSCWAVAAAEGISDRYCTVAGKRNVSVAAADLMACCSSCGMGCNGGFPEAAWEYWVSTGLVTTGCWPYPFPKCEHHVPAAKYPACPSGEYPTPSCRRSCVAAGEAWAPMKGSRAYSVSGEEDMKKELVTNGPFEVTLTVYADFPTYKSGVYRHKSGQALGGHAVKVVGYGEEDGTPYWIINNSWNEDWGDHGTFKILRGSNECGIESGGAAGLP